MIPKALLPFLLLLESVSSDRLRFHLENLVDRNISACDDFYHHVCSQKANPEEFFTNRFKSIFQDALERLGPDAVKNSPIEYDLHQVRTRVDRKEDNDYESDARLRCKKDIRCYIDDQEYYINIADLIKKTKTIRATETNPDESPEEAINRHIADTSSMIDEMIPFTNSFPSFHFESDYFRRGYYLHEYVHTRIKMIEFMKSNSTYSDFYDVKNVTEHMKRRMIENIENSAWLYGDEIIELVRAKITETVASIQIFHDFDEIDKNLTTIQKINRDLNYFYFSERRIRKTGAHSLDTLLGLREAYIKLEQNSPPEIRDFIHRIMSNFNFNAFFNDKLKQVTILAPYIYRPEFESDIMKEPVITYATIAHELFHSLFNTAIPTLMTLYAHRRKCIIDHYERTFSKFAMGECMSGVKTFSEDGSDLEGLRLAHALLREIYTAEELNSAIDGLDTTLEQAFFYYASSEYCEKDVDRTLREALRDPHSAGNIRVNGAFSIMPEFTAAFGCEAGDAMFIADEDSCDVFGPYS